MTDHDQREEVLLAALYASERAVNSARYSELVGLEPALRQAAYTAKKALEENLEDQRKIVEARSKARIALRDFYAGEKPVDIAVRPVAEEDVHTAVRLLADPRPETEDRSHEPETEGEEVRTRIVIDGFSETTDADLIEARRKDAREAEDAQRREPPPSHAPG